MQTFKLRQNDNGFEIRKAQITDLEQLQALYIEAAQWIYTSQGFYQWREERFTKAYLDQFIAVNDVFVAHLDGA